MNRGELLTSNEASVSAPAAEVRRRPVLEKLEHAPHLFDFFQAVRLLMRLSQRAPGGETPAARPVGHDFPPDSEVVRFRTLASHTFPQSEIFAFHPPAAAEAGRPSPAEMTIGFLGLTGPVGVLPQHYTQMVIDRIRLKDRTLHDFLDHFSHRTISLFYRAWEKHRVPVLLERASGEGGEDPFTRALYCIVGFGDPSLRKRLEIRDQRFLYYSGLFAHFPRNATSLERMIGDLFGLPVGIQQFEGQWLTLESSEQTAMPSRTQPGGLNCQLGVTAIAGERVWSIESKFRIRLGPLNYRTFQSLLPGGRRLMELGQLTRTYVGPEFDFDAQLVLRRDEVPPCQLGAADGLAPRLGWNTWACSVMRLSDAEEAVFVPRDRPTR